MNKDFFSKIEEHRDSYAKRAGIDQADVHVTFHGGRTVLLDKVVTADESWLVIDGRDLMDEETAISLSAPYHQVAAVQFVPRRERIGKTGF